MELGGSRQELDSGTTPQQSCQGNESLDQVSDFEGKSSFGVVVTLTNDREDLVNGGFHREGAVEDAEVALNT